MKFLKKIPLKFWIILAACTIVFTVSYFRLTANLELLTYDFRLQLRPPLATLGDIVIIEIDDSSVQALGVWPFPRDAHAALLNYLRYAGAKAVFFDILFSEDSYGRSSLPPNTHGAVDFKSEDLDFRFEQYIRESGNVYLSEAFEISESPFPGLQPPSARRYTGPILARFKQYIRGAGHINTITDADSKIRRIPLFIRYQNTFVPHVALKMACDEMGLDVGKVVFHGRQVIIDKKLSLPISDSASFMVNYPAGWVSSFTHVSYVDLIEAQNNLVQGGKPTFDPAKLKGKVCFVGLTATGTHDLKGMPFEKLYPMVGLQASVYNSIMMRKFITDIGPLANSFLNLIVFLVSLFVCFYFLPLKALWRVVILAAVYFISAAGLLFVGLWIDLFLPLLVIAVTYVVLTLYKFIEEVHKRQLIEKELEIAHAIQESFLPRDITDHADITINAFMQPAKFVAGDLYDFVKISDHELGVFIGDVSGKGASASLIMAQTVSLFRIFSRQYREPHEVMNALNRELAAVLSGRFVTATYVILDTKEKTVHGVCAGHLPVLGLTEGMVCEFFAAGGPPLGVVDTVEYEAESISLMSGERILLYTDGLIEARNKKGEEYGIEQLKNLFSKNSTAPVAESLPAMMKEFLEFCRDLPQFDDITAIQLSCP
ncbi:MAG: CHASE2 domain-containing protein [Candidatus Omnitrophota bacterium]|nr:CHASE2 domain-containing protein [Candidatus Omnitrophota bacterium]